MQQVGNDAPDLDSAEDLKAFFAAIQRLNEEGKLLAYHDRSDGGLYATLCEMAFAGRTGVSVNLDILAMEGEHASDWGDSKNWASQVGERRNEMTLRALFNEELGAVLQVRADQRSDAMNVLREFGLGACSHIIGKLNPRDADRIHPRRQSHLQGAAHRAAKGLERDQLAHRPAARQPGLRRRRIQPHRRRGRPGHRATRRVRHGAGRGRALHRHRRPSARGHPARAGRELAYRNRLRDAQGRLRRGRRAHERPDRRPRPPGRLQGRDRGRRLFLRRRAGRGRGLGQDHPVQHEAGRAVFRSSSTATTPSRWASATAAR